MSEVNEVLSLALSIERPRQSGVQIVIVFYLSPVSKLHLLRFACVSQDNVDEFPCFERVSQVYEAPTLAPSVERARNLADAGPGVATLRGFMLYLPNRLPYWVAALAIRCRYCLAILARVSVLMSVRGVAPRGAVGNGMIVNRSKTIQAELNFQAVKL